MGLDARKPVLGDLRTTQAQTSLVIAFWKVSNCMPEFVFSQHDTIIKYLYFKNVNFRVVFARPLAILEYMHSSTFSQSKRNIFYNCIYQ